MSIGMIIAMVIGFFLIKIGFLPALFGANGLMNVGVFIFFLGIGYFLFGHVFWERMFEIKHRLLPPV